MSVTEKYIIPGIIIHGENATKHLSVSKGLFGRTVVYTNDDGVRMGTNFDKLLGALKDKVSNISNNKKNLLEALRTIEELEKQERGFFARRWPTVFGRAKQIDNLRKQINEMY